MLSRAGAGKDFLAVRDQGGEHKYLLREIRHMLGRGNQRGRKHSCQIVLIHLVDGIMGRDAAIAKAKQLISNTTDYGHRSGFDLPLQMLQHILQAIEMRRWQATHGLGH